MKKSLSLFIMSTLLLTGLTQVANAQEVDPKRKSSTASISFESGGLNLVEVTPLTFGKIVIGSSADFIYEAEANESQIARVNDYRGLANGEWSLSASISGFTDDNEVQTLPGFTLKFGGGTAKANTATNTLSGPAVNTPTMNDVAGENGAVRFLTATAGQGRGSWSAEWTNVVLSIPEGSETVGNYTATITWTLTNAAE